MTIRLKIFFLPIKTPLLLVHTIGWQMNCFSLAGTEVSPGSHDMPEPVEILLVEDYEPDAQLILILLKKHQIANKVRFVRDGGEALDFMFCRGAYRDRSFEHPPGVVLLDIRMPKMDGLEVLSQIRQHPQTRQVPVVMLSGSLFPEDLAKARRLGALGCIPKPLQFEKLRDLLAESGFTWLLMSQALEDASNK